jgi:hypothetical protein
VVTSTHTAYLTVCLPTFDWVPGAADSQFDSTASVTAASVMAVTDEFELDLDSADDDCDTSPAAPDAAATRAAAFAADGAAVAAQV